jgi:hypothetical protein
LRTPQQLELCAGTPGQQHLVCNFLSQQNNNLFLFIPELTDLFVAGRDQSAADQPSNLAESHPSL